MKYCCDGMKKQLTHKCVVHKNDIDSCPDKVVTYYKNGNAYGLPIKDGGCSFMMISY